MQEVSDEIRAEFRFAVDAFRRDVSRRDAEWGIDVVDVSAAQNSRLDEKLALYSFGANLKEIMTQHFFREHIIIKDVLTQRDPVSK